MAFLSDIICKYEDEANQKIAEAREMNSKSAPKESIFFESPRYKQARAANGSYSTNGTRGGSDGIFLNSPIPAYVKNSQAATVPRLQTPYERRLSSKTGMAGIAEEAKFLSEEIKRERDEKWQAMQNGELEDTQATQVSQHESEAEALRKQNEELKAQLAQMRNNQ